jgi:hypothetical protein
MCADDDTHVWQKHLKITRFPTKAGNYPCSGESPKVIPRCHAQQRSGPSTRLHQQHSTSRMAWSVVSIALHTRYRPRIAASLGPPGRRLCCPWRAPRAREGRARGQGQQGRSRGKMRRGARPPASPPPVLPPVHQRQGQHNLSRRRA